MHCNTAQALLLEYVAGELSPPQQIDLEQHLSGCDQCRAELATVTALHTNAATLAADWMDETIPPHLQARQALQTTRPKKSWDEYFRLWFPSFASATALVLIAVLYFQLPTAGPSLPGPNTANRAANYDQLPPLPQSATQAALVQSVLESSQEQRAKEIQALLKVLKAEMDKRSIQTEESLRYIISHQIQGQQEMDELYRQVEQLMQEELTTQATNEGSM